MSESDDDVIQDRRKYELHEAIVFAVELTDTMLAVDPATNKSNLQIVLEALQEAMAHSVITLPSTGYGCYFFNSKETTKGFSPRVQRIFSLKDLNYHDMKTVFDILEDNTKPQFGDDRPYIPLHERFHPDDSDPATKSPLLDLFTQLQVEMSVKKDFQKQYTIRKIFLFTDNDKPVPVNDTDKKSHIRNVCRDLDEMKITISPFFLHSLGKPFDSGLYSEIMTLSGDGLNEDEADDTQLFDGPSTKPIEVRDISSRILRRKEIKRIQFQCPLIFSDELKVGLKGYSVYSHEKTTKTKFVYETENYRKNVYSTRRLISSKDTSEVDKSVRTYKIGPGEDDFVMLTPEQDEKLNKYDEDHPTFLRLIGFKDEKTGVKLHYNSTTSPFVVPDEDSWTGSTRAISALYQSLKKTGKVAIVFGKVRKSSQPSMYALHATKKSLFFGSSAYFPEGFFLVRLPYFNDIRQFPPGYGRVAQTPSVQLKAKTKMILRELSKRMEEYTPSEFKNPALQQHYRTLHDYLLQVEQPMGADKREHSIKHDDTLRTLDELRLLIESSEGGRLLQHLKDWNNIYSSLSA